MEVGAQGTGMEARPKLHGVPTVPRGPCSCPHASCCPLAPQGCVTTGHLHFLVFLYKQEHAACALSSVLSPAARLH